jgi:hypothetical protein
MSDTHTTQTPTTSPHIIPASQTLTDQIHQQWLDDLYLDI